MRILSAWVILTLVLIHAYLGFVGLFAVSWATVGYACNYEESNIDTWVPYRPLGCYLSKKAEE